MYWFALCNLQIFSGCVCHLDNFTHNLLFYFQYFLVLIWFFFSIFAQFFRYFHSGCSSVCSFAWATTRLYLLLFVVLAGGVWCSTAGCHVKSPLFPQSPLQTEVCCMIGESIQDRRLFTIQRSPRISTSYKFAVPRYRLPCRLFRWASNLAFQQHWRSLSRAVVIKTKSLPVSATTFPTVLSLYIMHTCRSLS